MDVSASQVEEVVRKILSEMASSSASSSSGCCEIPKTGKVAILQEPKKFVVKEYPIPALTDDDILVKVEGAGVCGTDVHEWKGDPFGLCPLVLGHEGTGTIIYLGKNIKCDTAGHPIKVGDKIVTSVISDDTCFICRNHPGQKNLCWNQGIYGLVPLDEKNPFRGWFSTHLLIRDKGSTYFVVNDLNLNQRMLLEVACVCVHAYLRGQATGLLNFNSKVVLQGCGPVGLMMCAVLRAAGINHVIAVDGNDQRLEMAKKLGAKTTINYREMTDKKDRVAKVLALTDGAGADFAYQCTGAPGAAADIYDFIRRGGGMCEMGFFVNNGEYQVNPHFAMCNKEINLVGSWAYSAEDYPVTMAFLRQCQEMNIPIEDLITHNFPLDKMNEAMEVNVARQGIKICYIAN
ncbi:MAG: zinc-binding dehydrogenase [Clostridia bacterium]|nr:zinc-binding dehydrogenase [Clostridia bacterium]